MVAVAEMPGVEKKTIRSAEGGMDAQRTRKRRLHRRQPRGNAAVLLLMYEYTEI